MNIHPNWERLNAIVQDLVAIPSHYKEPGGETAVALKLGEYALEAGLSVELEEITPGRSNIEILLKGNHPGPRLLFCGHLDTVTPAGMEIDPFDPVIRDGKIWGRGSVDMKGGLAAMLAAMIQIKESGEPFAGSVTLIGTVGEECPRNADGAYTLRKRGRFADFAVIGEATCLDIAAAHKGTLSLEIDIKGKAAHSSNPALGDSAIYKAVDLIARIKGDLLPRLAERKHPLCGTATLNVGVIAGGIQNNIVPDRCSFTLNRRYIPGELEEDIVNEILELWNGLDYPPEDIRIEVLEETENRVPMETDPEDPYVGKLLEVCRSLGLDSRIYGANYWTDGAHLRAAGIPTVIFGPGDIKEAHSAREYIDIDSLRKGMEAYAAFIREVCR